MYESSVFRFASSRWRYSDYMNSIYVISYTILEVDDKWCRFPECSDTENMFDIIFILFFVWILIDIYHIQT
jgi:hypothetical protein